jgi:dolichol-phosphate mannosyltransferase
MSLISVVIPAKNEAENIERTVEGIGSEFQKQGLPYEIIVVNDGSTDDTEVVVQHVMERNDAVRLVQNQPPYGFGYAIRKGLDAFKGDYVIITMADSSDDPADMVRYIEQMQKGFDCCFGDRWGNRAVVNGYPTLKRILNRLGNWAISVLFQMCYRDVTNAFKAYSRQTINGLKPILSRHFNITVELPLKAIIRGYSYTIIPTNWHERRKNKTSFKLQEMESRYLFIIMYALLEKALCGSDYKKANRGIVAK